MLALLSFIVSIFKLMYKDSKTMSLC